MRHEGLDKLILGGSLHSPVTSGPFPYPFYPSGSLVP